MSIENKVSEMYKLIQEIGAEDPGAGTVFLEGFGLSMNILRAMAENGGNRVYDYSEHLKIISNVMGFSLEDLVQQILERKAQENGNSSKPVDEDTLGFITSKSDLDDYERFVAENSAKENLDFLSKEI